MPVLRKLVCGDNRDPPPRPGLDKPAAPRNEGDLPTPFILLGEDFEGEFREVGVAGVLGFAPSGGGFLLGLDMVVLLEPWFRLIVIVRSANHVYKKWPIVHSHELVDWWNDSK